MRSKDFKCMSAQGSTKILSDFISKMEKKTIFLDRAETLLHNWFGDEDYWAVRRSMRFAKPLVDLANHFRKETLNSDDEKDKTEVSERWEDHQPERSLERGGNYLCVHLRRKDYAFSRKDQIPSVKGAADQIKKKLEAYVQ